MKRNENRGISRYEYLWSAVLVLAISSLIVTMQSLHEAEAKHEKENLALKTKTQSPELPPIDKVVPPIIGTATFGLG